MNVKDALSLPSFEGASVIAGEAGLTREVSTAMVVEAPDIASWGEAGQLLITSFFAFEGLTSEELGEFFEKASELGIGAIVFKPERLVAEAPEEVISLCNEHKIPLVQIPAETKYEALLLDVLGNFLRSALEQKAFFQNNNLMRELLSEPAGDPVRTKEALKALGVDAYPNYEVLAIKLMADGSADQGQLGEALATACRRLKARYPKTAYLETSDSLVFLHNVRGAATRYEANAVAAVMKDAAAGGALTGLPYLAALSSLGKAGELPSLMRQAGDILSFFDSDRYEDAFLRFEDLGIYRLFMKATDASELMGYIDPRVQALHDENPELLETAQALCDNSLNYQETARQLYMHPKTIRYRAERVRKLTGLDFHNPDDRLQISLGGRIYQLLENKR